MLERQWRLNQSSHSKLKMKFNDFLRPSQANNLKDLLRQAKLENIVGKLFVSGETDHFHIPSCC